ncbi:MAG: hypothetical protein ACYS0I_09695 [Planctomycetota bacterium]|jgi:hypothetical protein
MTTEIITSTPYWKIVITFLVPIEKERWKLPFQKQFSNRANHRAIPEVKRNEKAKLSKVKGCIDSERSDGLYDTLRQHLVEYNVDALKPTHYNYCNYSVLRENVIGPPYHL